MADVLRQAHAYYADSDSYTHFVVITQSCDLVRRRGKKINAPYITVAATKQFEKSFTDQFRSHLRPLKKTVFSFQPRSRKQNIRQLLERYLNNTEQEFFFLPQRETGSPEMDLLVFLRLSVALRPEHYEVLASSKCAELDEIFQAKLGWLKGNIYSRVATPDVEERISNSEEFKTSFFDRYMKEDEYVWLTDLQADRVRDSVRKRYADLGRDLTVDETYQIIESEAKPDIEILAENILEKMVKNKVIDASDGEQMRKAKNSILNESTLKTLVARQS